MSRILICVEFSLNALASFEHAEMLMRRIDLIDWTFIREQPRLDHAKPHLQLLCASGVQISLDAISGSDPEI